MPAIPAPATAHGNRPQTSPYFGKLMSNPQCFEVYFDGACPICSREMAMIRKLDKHGQIQFTDIADRNFDAIALGLDPQAVNQQIHGRMSDGSILTGVEVFRQVYGVLGFRHWVSWSRRPLIAWLLDFCYARFAKYRQQVTMPFRWLKRTGSR